MLGGRIMEYERKAEPIGRELVRRLLPRRDPEAHKVRLEMGKKLT